MIRVEQLDISSIDTLLATDEDLASLHGVTKEVLLERLGTLTAAQIAALGISQTSGGGTGSIDLSKYALVTDMGKRALSTDLATLTGVTKATILTKLGTLTNAEITALGIIQGGGSGNIDLSNYATQSSLNSTNANVS